MKLRKHWWFLPLLLIGIILAVLIVLALLGCVSKLDFANFVISAVLLLTFFAILLYTKYSAELAKMNENIARVQEEDFRERRTPRVVVGFVPSKEDKMHISIVLKNLNAHKVRLTLDLNLNYRNKKIPIDDGFYNGSKEWFLNPVDLFQGHHNFRDDLGAAGLDFNKIKQEEKKSLVSGKITPKDFLGILFYAPVVKLTSEFEIKADLWKRLYYYNFEKDEIYPYPGLS